MPKELSLVVDCRLYPEEVVFKAVYWYGDRYDVRIDRSGDDALTVNLRPLGSDLSDEVASALEERFYRDLIDHRTRHIVSKETASIRELLVAKAFSHSEEFDLDPPGSISDPVGYDPGA